MIPHPSAFAPYLRQGWCLVPVPLGTKGPTHTGWNTKEACICGSRDIAEGFGAGLGHAFSNTCAIDLDDLFAASLLFAERGLDINAYLNAPDAVQIISGRPGSGKLIYELTTPLPSKKLNLAGKTAMEFRCGTAVEGRTQQDVLPPSMHPSGTQYQWAGKGSWQSLPPLPFELWVWWQELLASQSEPTSDPATPVEMPVIIDALNAIDPSCDRKTWIESLMGVKATGDPEAFEICRKWSAGSKEKYPGDHQFGKQWASLRNDHPAGITPATVIFYAKQYGWQPPPPDFSSLFANITPASPHEMLQVGKPIPNMRLDLFPKLLADYATELGNEKGASPNIPAMAGMVSVSAACDARTRIHLKPGLAVPSTFWVATIAPPGSKKTPASGPMFSPLERFESEDRIGYALRLHQWEAFEASHVSAQKAYEQAAANADWLMQGQDLSLLPIVPPLPPKPVPLRFIVHDATSQKLAYLCAERPRGMTCILDEGAGWVNRISSSGSGDNRSTIVQSYEAQNHYFDRVGAGSLLIENFATSIYINLQPAVIAKAYTVLCADGLLQRFVPCLVPEHELSSVGKAVPSFLSLRGAWEQCLRRIHAATDGGKEYRVCPEGLAEVERFEHWIENFKTEERILRMPGEYQESIAKIMGFLGRIVLNWHLVDAPDTLTVPLLTVRNAIEWVKSYLIPAFGYFHSCGEVAESFDKWIGDWLITTDQPVVTVADINRSARHHKARHNLSAYEAKETIEASMALYEAAGWIKRIEEMPGMARERTPRYAVNQAVHEHYADHRRMVAKLKQARLDEVRDNTIASTGKMTPRRFTQGYQEVA